MRYQTLLWDFDGTLAYTSKDVWNSLIYAAQQLGAKFPASYLKDDAHLGKSVRELFSEIKPYPGDAEFQRFAAFVTTHYQTISEYSDTYLYQGIGKLLLELKAENVQQFIITMKPEKALMRILEKKAWAGLFDGCLSPDSFGERTYSKSEMIAHFLQERMVSDYDCVYIGDSWGDVRAAHENDLACIAVTYGDGDTKLLLAEKPEYAVTTVSELKKMLTTGG